MSAALTALGSTLILGGALLVTIPELRRAKKENANASKSATAMPAGS